MSGSRTLWKLYAYSRYGETKTIGYLYYTDSRPDACIDFSKFNAEIEGQPCCLSFDIVSRKEDEI